jgi:hypothetical protein
MELMENDGGHDHKFLSWVRSAFTPATGVAGEIMSQVFLPGDVLFLRREVKQSFWCPLSPLRAW